MDIFSATSGHPGIKGVLGEPLAKLNGVLFGKRARSNYLTFNLWRLQQKISLKKPIKIG